MIDASPTRVVKLLARYWCDNPFACDTPEGIHRWWLSSTDGVAIEQVQRALAWLRDRGVIEQIVSADGRARYRRANEADLGALRMLAEHNGSGMPPPRRVS